MKFEQIIGNENVKEILTGTIKSNTVLHSYLFLGTSGIGKSIFAREFAKMLLCTNEQDKPCGHCKSCIEFDTDNHPDFYWIHPDVDTIKIEQIRLLQSKVVEKPIVSDRKVYIINDSDTMTKEAQNCLLKTLEEPPHYVTIILIGSNENLYLNTIKSRCTKIGFLPIENTKLKQYLETEQGFPEIGVNLLPMYGGSIGRAIALKDKKETYEQIEKITDTLAHKDLIEVIKEAEILYKNKEDSIAMLEYMNVLLFNQVRKSIKYTNCMNAIEETKKRLKANSNYDMCIDSMLFKIWEELNT